jgi:hypothetical protein
VKQADKGFPSLKELNTFIEQKCKDLEILKPSTNIANLKETRGGKQKVKVSMGFYEFVAMTENKCVF